MAERVPQGDKDMNKQTRNCQEWAQKHPLVWGLVLVVAFSLLRALQAFAWRQWFDTVEFYETIPFALFLLGSFVLVSVGLIGGGIVWLTKTSWRDLGWRRKGLVKAIGLGLLGFVLLFVNTMVWPFVGGATEPPKLITPGPARLLLVAFFAFGIAAWVEENLFRGYLQPILAKSVSLWMAIVIQALLFAAAHLGWFTRPLDFASAFVAGLILGWLRGRDRSLVAPFLAHGLLWIMVAFSPLVI